MVGFAPPQINNTYIDNIPQPVDITAETQDIQLELEEKVNEMVTVTEGHWAPTFYFIGLGGKDAYGKKSITFYLTPMETIYTLSLIYPYVSPSLQQDVKTYLDNHMQTYSPLSTKFYMFEEGAFDGTASTLVGASREYYVPNPDQKIGWWPHWPEVHPAIMYVMWLYSYNTNDWSYVTDRYSTIKSIYTDDLKNRGSISSYPELAAAIGFARIANQLGETDDYNDAISFVDSNIAGATNFDTFLSTAETNYPDEVLTGHGYTTSIFFFGEQEQDVNESKYIRNPICLHFNRDIGIFLNDNAQSSVRTYTEQIAKDVPMWWLTAPAFSHGENAYAPPEMSWTNFMLHAYALGDSTSTLKGYLDAPDRKADLLYMQKLVAVIESSTGGEPVSQPDLSQSNKVASVANAQVGDTIDYIITIKNTGDPFSSTVTMTDNLPDGLVYVADSLTAPSGTTDDSDTTVLTWSGVMNGTPEIAINFSAVVEGASETATPTATSQGDTATPTATSQGDTATPTATSQGDTATPTATSSSGTPLATATSGSGDGDLDDSVKWAKTIVEYTVEIKGNNIASGETVYMRDAVPPGATYIEGSMQATSGTINDSNAPTLNWQGVKTAQKVEVVQENIAVVTYRVEVNDPDIYTEQSAVIWSDSVSEITRYPEVEALIRNYIPLILKSINSSQKAVAPAYDLVNEAIIESDLTGRLTPQAIVAIGDSSGTATNTPIPTATSDGGETPTATPTPATETVTRRINVPSLPHTSDEGNFQKLAIAWFGEIDDGSNFVNVRVGHSPNVLRVTLTAFDRFLTSDVAMDQDALTEWDAASFYINLDGNTGDVPNSNSHLFVGQFRLDNNPNENYERTYTGDGSDWIDADTSFKTYTGWRGSDGGPNDQQADKGWQISFYLTFTDLGLSGPPDADTIWGVAFKLHDKDDHSSSNPNIPDMLWPESFDDTKPDTWGQLYFTGSEVPEYTPPDITQTGEVTIRNAVDDAEVIDAHVGGGATCGMNEDGSYMDFWAEWPVKNYDNSGALVVQNQIEIADWPCFSRVYLTFPIDSIPTDKTIYTATLTMYQFGGSDPSQAQPSYIQALSIAEDWDESTINWNNAPLAVENITLSVVDVVQGTDHLWDDLPAWHWDVSKAVNEAYNTGDTHVRLALYSADEYYHSGKYFSSSDRDESGEDPDWNEQNRPKLTVTWGD